MTKNLFLKTCTGILFSASLLLVLLGCPQNKKLQPGKNDLKLNVTTLKIHGRPVENGKVTVYNKTITYKNVEAFCQYGDVTDELIDVTVKDEPFQCNNDGSEKILELSIPAKAGVYSAWNKTVAVKYENQDNNLILQTLTVHGYSVLNGKVVINKDTIEAKDIKAVFRYGNTMGITIPVKVEGGKVNVNKTGITNLSLSVAEKENEYKDWEQTIEVSYDKDLKPSLQLSSMEIHKHKVKDGKIAIKENTIEAANIDAEFTYSKNGTPKTEIIPVTVEGGTFIIDKNVPKPLKLSIAKTEDYEAWYGEIIVRYNADSNAKDNGIFVYKKPAQKKSDGSFFIEVPETKPEEEILKNIEVAFENPTAYFKLENGKSEDFEKKYDEKTVIINTYAENNQPGATYSLKLIRFDMEETVNITPPAEVFSSGLNYDKHADKWVLNKDRKIGLDPYAIAKYEIPYALWKRVYDWAVNQKENPKYQFQFEGICVDDDIYAPVTYVSWADAVIWCNAYSEYKAAIEKADVQPLYIKAGTQNEILRSSKSDEDFTDCLNADIKLNAKGYRLPTEVEWEFAARGGNIESPQWKFQYAGTDITSELSDYAWFDENSEGKAHRCGLKKGNSAGIYDMMGNVFEWCFDFADLKLGFPQTEVINPAGLKNTTMPIRAQRGSGFISREKALPISNRVSGNAALDDEQNGFRVVLASLVRNYTKQDGQKPAPVDIEEIQIGKEIFSKGNNLDSLNGKEIVIESGATSVEITVKMSTASAHAGIRINDKPEKPASISFENGIAKYTLPVNGLVTAVLEVSDLDKESVSYTFSVKSADYVPPAPPPPPPPPGPPGPPPPPPPLPPSP